MRLDLAALLRDTWALWRRDGALLVPLFYVYARTTLIAPALAAEAPLGAIAAILRSWRLTSGNGWQLAWLLAAVMLGSSILGGSFLALGKLAGDGAAANPVLAGLTATAATAVEAAATLAVALIGVVAYRRLASSGT